MLIIFVCVYKMRQTDTKSILVCIISLILNMTRGGFGNDTQLMIPGYYGREPH